MKHLARVIATLMLVLMPAVPVHAASGPTVPPAPIYPSWGCTGTCNNLYGNWSLSAGSSLTSNYGSAYSPDVVYVNVNSLVVSGGGIVDVSVDGIDRQISANGTYTWPFSNPNPYHVIIVYADFSTQGNFLVSEQPGTTQVGAGTPTSTPIPTNTPYPLGGQTATPTPTNTPCTIDAWGCDQPATATYVACESGVTVNYGLDPCGPTATATPTATPNGSATATPAPSYRTCGVLANCDMVGSSTTVCASSWTCAQQDGSNYADGNCAYKDAQNACIILVNANSLIVDVRQSFVAYASGYLCETLSYSTGENGMPETYFVNGGTATAYRTYGRTTTFNGCQGGIVAGNTYSWAMENNPGTDRYANIDAVYLSSSSSGGTPIPTATATAAPTATNAPTFTPGPTWTPRPTATTAPTATAVPGATDTMIANIDSCLALGNCSGQVTPIAGVATGIAVPIGTKFAIDTSPLSALQHLSTARSACTSFGKAPIVVPQVTDVPGGNAATPDTVAYTWTTLSASTAVISGTTWDYTQVQPCAMPAIPSFVWDLSWYGSVIAIFVLFIVWLFVYIRRLFT